MRFSFVFAKGLMVVGGDVRHADDRIYHMDLPRAAALLDPVSGRVQGDAVFIAAIDVLGAVRAISGGGAWGLSGSRAQLTGARCEPYAEGEAVLQNLEELVAAGTLLEGSGTVELSSRVRSKRWVAHSPSRVGGSTVSSGFAERAEAEAWLQ